ncbi:MAG: acetyl-CoA C-acetyltransferase [Sphingobacteriales bacterium]|nr:acetyl-CoA C-acetyltransferase [Sphingobacteriales bacterium]
MTEAYIYDALRTPRGRGKKNGSLYEIKPIDLLQTLFHALQHKHHLDTALVDDVVLGCVTPVGEQGMDIAKTAVLYAGWDTSVAGVQLNRFCASGLEAVNLAAMKIRSGWDELVVAGGVESMSRIPMGSDGGAWISDPEVNRRLGFIPQGISADLIATREGFSRLDLDNYALLSHRRAAQAQTEGRFATSLVTVRDQNGLPVLSHDELIRTDASLEALAALNPSFAAMGEMGFDAVAMQRYPAVARIDHQHTPGNSSGIVDGAALVLVANRAMGERLGIKPRARIVAAAATGSEPTIMLEGPAPAARLALRKAGMQASDIDLWETNEAFAAAVLKFQREMNLSPEQLNVNGGAIAMGHPLGATGAMLVGTVLDELERRNLQTGLITLCVGGGMGVATIIERV